MKVNSVFIFALFILINVIRALPNVVILVADDLGIGDIGCYGNTTIKTPHIDSLAKDGLLLNHLLAAAGLCTPSRAALLTGRYPARFGLVGTENTPPVIAHVASRVGLPHTEITIADALRKAGYATGAVGKWHLGSGCQKFGFGCDGAVTYGFDYFYGILFTLMDAMGEDCSFWIFDLKQPFYQALVVCFGISMGSIIYLMKHFSQKVTFFLSIISMWTFLLMWFMFTHYRLHTSRWWQVSPWMDKNLNGIIVKNGEVVSQTIPFESLTENLVSESVQFINRNSNSVKPFFLYHSFAHVHTPMFSGEAKKSKSQNGRYGDNVEELDDGVGTILAALKENQIEDSTIVYFISDHGGHLEGIDPKDGQRIGGYNKLFKGGKGMGAPEGAIRVPGIIRWPLRIPTGISLDIPVSLMDILPSTLELANLPSIQELFNNSNTLDGISVARNFLFPKTPSQENRILLHHCRQSIHALRLITDLKIYKMYLYLHRWKENSTQCGWGEVICGCYGDDVIDVTESPVVFELNSDPYEDHPLDKNTEEYKMVVEDLQDYLTTWRKKVSYPKSLYSSKMDTILLPWIQPFKL